MASEVQIATLIAACVSAVGSCATALVGYFRYRRETAQPVVSVINDELCVRIWVRNRSPSDRTVYQVGFCHGRQMMNLLDPSAFGPNLPKVIVAYEREEWKIPYKEFREAWDRVPWWLRNSFSAFAELGESIYFCRIPPHIVQTSSKVLT
jgi:hypothetical protein